MIEGLMIKLAVLAIGTTTSFIFGYFKGKNSVKVKQLKSNIKNAVKTQKRRKKRSSDSMAIVRRRMRKYTIG